MIHDDNNNCNKNNNDNLTCKGFDPHKPHNYYKQGSSRYEVIKSASVMQKEKILWLCRSRSAKRESEVNADPARVDYNNIFYNCLCF